MSLRRLASVTLVFNLAVILWGGYVRASGSGAGCGRHWPLCNGAVVPTAPAVATLVEYGHRVTSGIALILVLVLAWRVFRASAAGDRVRKAAVASVVLIVTEALVGAGLVLLQLVGDNSSLLRAAYLAVHLTNTFALLAALTLVTLWTTEPSQGTQPRYSVSSVALAALGLLLIVGIAGAITALGDTLFPAASIAEGLLQDRSATAHLLIRLRVIHPILAVAMSFVVLGLALRALQAESTTGRMAARWVIGLTVSQLGIGVINLVLLVPIATQLLHLLTADLLWIAVIWMIAGGGSADPRPAATPRLA